MQDIKLYEVSGCGWSPQICESGEWNSRHIVGLLSYRQCESFLHRYRNPPKIIEVKAKFSYVIWPFDHKDSSWIIILIATQLNWLENQKTISYLGTGLQFAIQSRSSFGPNDVLHLVFEAQQMGAEFFFFHF